MPDVWTYWQGPRPCWISLCLETIATNVPGATILDPASWDDLYDGLDVPRHLLNRQLPNVKSDFIRAWILRHHGGVWVDADAIVFRDLSSLAKPGLFTCYRAHGKEYCTALLATRDQTNVGHEYYTEMVRRLRQKKGRLHRLSLGPRVLTAAIRRCGSSEVSLVPADLVHPWPYWLRKDGARLWQDGSDHSMRHLDHADAYCFMLTHRALGPMRTWSRDAILDSCTLPGRLFRRALGLDPCEYR